MKKALVYLQDVGGTNYLLPFLKALNRRNDLKVQFTYVIHPLSKKTVENYSLRIASEEHFFFPIDEVSWSDYLIKNNFSFIVSTLSSNKVDDSNAKLITAAKKHNVPTLGFLDHWKGFDRLMGVNSQPVYTPAWLGVIDSYASEKITKLDIDDCVVKIVGHPFFEEIILKRLPNYSKSKRLLLVSQPNINCESFSSLYETKIQGKRLIDILVDKLNCDEVQYDIFYRPHPKEKELGCLPAPIKLDTTDKNDIFANYDTFIGFNSALLFEATLAQRFSISLTLPIFDYVYEDEIPFSFSVNVSQLEGLTDKIRAREAEDLTLDPEVFVNSTQRCISCFYEFMNQMEFYA